MTTMKQVKEKAIAAGKRVSYNRALGGYQIIAGFNASEVIAGSRDEKGRMGLSEDDLKALARMI